MAKFGSKYTLSSIAATKPAVPCVGASAVSCWYGALDSQSRLADLGWCILFKLKGLVFVDFPHSLDMDFWQTPMKSKNRGLRCMEYDGSL